MGYVNRILEPDERVFEEAKIHWIVYIKGVLFFFGGIALVLVNPEVDSETPPIAGVIGALLFLIGIYLLIAAAIEQMTTELVVSDRRVIAKTGLIWRSTREIHAQKIESVDVQQSILGRMLNYGSVIVRGTGLGINPLKNIRDPLTIRRAISSI